MNKIKDEITEKRIEWRSDLGIIINGFFYTLLFITIICLLDVVTKVINPWVTLIIMILIDTAFYFIKKDVDIKIKEDKKWVSGQIY